ncbi:MAG: hypothetical protein E6K78_00665 [Candidatus Eisenbacteria bacterium]|uniref:DUF3108 domain-containing protein n=1 Tax=Eiseniibacteriota bacterium TaxID=2212470 RepID=A0A538TXX8_UNCEI|nr:MAG: hypothetical protein E6K78_00665 [Candidatus Eisenbacteria bacterium]
MRRAARFLLAAISLLAIGRSALAQSADQVIDASGMMDYMRPPDFKVGTWVKYHVKSTSLQGYEDDYTVTVLAAGEEVFWGEPCFWVETWVERKDRPPRFAASLISFAAFGDTMATRHPIWFTRKTIEGYDENNLPDEAIVRRQANEMKLRAINYEQEHRDTWIYRDTLGTDTTTVPAGTFKGLKIKVLRPWAETTDRGDSTIYYERRETRTYYYSDRVPLTGFARMDIDDVQKGKTWPIGQSSQKPLNILERAQGSAVLIGQGTSGVTPLLVPESRRHSIDRGLTRESSPTHAPHPAGKRTGAKG